MAQSTSANFLLHIKEITMPQLRMLLNDVVYYNGSAYVAKQSTTGNVPTNRNILEFVCWRGTDNQQL